VRRKNKNKWTGYIAKTGHKWYPNESIAEHLLNSIGKELGLFMSNSELALISGQLRFLSEYFLNSKKQELVHGVDIFAGYVSDKDLVEEIEAKQLARTFFTFQFATDAVQFSFPNDADVILMNFVKLLLFDAIVGNNDRHFYNWGVVKSLDNSHKPYFSPIFDTARGLFWNDSEQKIREIIRRKHQMASYLKKYVKKSLPKIGWEGEKELNHIELITKIKQQSIEYSGIIDNLLTIQQEQNVIKMIQSNFFGLLSVNRMILITECLKLRFHELRNIK
jgi:HipA-like C-terminal domain